MKRAVRIVALVGLGLFGCEDRQVLHQPDPTLSRMLQQRRGDTWAAGVMRAPPRDTIAREDDTDDGPPPVTKALLEEGRAKFETVCATCHGVAGDGDSVVATKMEHRPPPSLHEARVKELSHAQRYTVITQGYALMPSLASVLTRHERWAVVAYLDALQLSQAAPAETLPEDLRQALGRVTTEAPR